MPRQPDRFLTPGVTSGPELFPGMLCASVNFLFGTRIKIISTHLSLLHLFLPISLPIRVYRIRFSIHLCHHISVHCHGSGKPPRGAGSELPGIVPEQMCPVAASQGCSRRCYPCTHRVYGPQLCLPVFLMGQMCLWGHTAP